MGSRSSHCTIGSSNTSRPGSNGSTRWTTSWSTSRKVRVEMAAKVSKGAAVVTLPTRTQVLITREFDAPRHLVYKAWTTPELIRRWWHANRGEVTSVDVDLRVGGKWRWVMLTHSGYECAFHGEYRELVPDQRIVYTEVFEGAPHAEAVT